MADGCCYIGRFECAVCQGVESQTDYCVLNCGHPFHVVCVETWLERSATCPSCRAKVNRRAIRTLTGVESVPDAPGDEALQQRLAQKEQQAEALHQQLGEKQQQLEQLSTVVCELSHKEERLRAKLSDAKRRASELEAAHLEDLQRLSNLSTEKQRLLEKYKTDTALLQHQVKDEQQRQRQATAELRRLQLSNPRLDASAIHAIAGLDGADQQSGATLAAILAQRNKELQEARGQCNQLQEQLRQQQAAASQEHEAERTRHEAEKGRVEQEKQQHMKDALQLEYENSKLKQDNKVLSQQLQELRTVLLALESSNAATTQPPARKCQEHLIRQHGSMLGQENTLPRGTAALNGQQQQQQRVPSSKRPSIVQHGRNGTVAPGQPACLPASLGEADSIQDVELLNDDDGWLPDQQLAANSPRSDSSQLLDELLEDFTGANDSQQQQPQHIYKGNHQQAQPGAHAQQQGQQQPQQHQSTQPKQHQQHAHQPLAAERPAGSCWQGGSQAGLGVAALGPGSCLHPGPAKQVPSFMAKGKVGPAGAVTGEFVRSGPDGRGNTAKHLKPGAKRVSHALPGGGGTAASKKLRVAAGGSASSTGATGFVGAPCSSKAAKFGIAAYFGKQ